MNKTIIITGVGFVIGVAEALLYYNLGQSAGGKFQYKLPPAKELFKTAGFVMASSLITGLISAGLETLLEEQREEKKLKTA
jgi:hypothetical protein